MKVVINTEYGGYALPHAIVMRYAEIKGIKLYPVLQGRVDENPNPSYEWYTYYSDKEMTQEFDQWKIPRHDPALVQAVEETRRYRQDLRVIEIPDGVDYVIMEYDGVEWVAERHRTWGYDGGDEDEDETLS